MQGASQRRVAMSDYKVTFTVKNNRLLRAMKDAGFASQTELARVAGVEQSAISAMIGMKHNRPARLKSGDWSTAVMKVCIALRVEPEDVFTDIQAQGLETNKFEAEVSENDIMHIMADSSSIEITDAKIMATKMLSLLTPREREIIERRMDGETYRECGANLESPIGPERVRQIEHKAFRKMRAKAYKSGDSTREASYYNGFTVEYTL
jgi:DNA-binding CsgD family transcriptional regulator